MYNLIHLIKVSKEDLEKYGPPTDFWEAVKGDYITHKLINADTKELLLIGDNCHTPIEAVIVAFINGMRYTKQKIEVKYGYYKEGDKDYVLF